MDFCGWLRLVGKLKLVRFPKFHVPFPLRQDSPRAPRGSRGHLTFLFAPKKKIEQIGMLNPANVQAVFKKSNLQFQPILKNTTDAQNVCNFYLRVYQWPHSMEHLPGVSKNRGTPKWMIYNGKPYYNG